jgi:sugar phosphate isomerase/epimerase
MVGIFSWYGIPQPFETRIKDIKNAGFDSVSMWIDEDGRWERDKDEIPLIIRDNGLLLEYAHAPYRNINHIWDERLSESVEGKYIAYIDYCRRHRIPILVMHATHGFRVKEVNGHGIALLERLVRHAKNGGVRIAVENTKSNGIMEKILSEIEDPALGLCFDTSHDNLHALHKFELMEKHGNRLLCLHISDNDGLADDHWIPFQGKIDWDDFIEKLPKGYDGVLNLEVVRKGKEISGPDFLKDAYKAIKTIEARIHDRKKAAARK